MTDRDKSAIVLSDFNPREMMAVRKKSARKSFARRTTSEPAPAKKPEEPKQPLIAKAVKSVQSLFNPKPEDPRPEAWLKTLEAAGRKEPIPRHLRIHQDDRFTGRRRRDQVDALVAVGMTAENAAQAILEAAMKEHRGQKHCDW